MKSLKIYTHASQGNFVDGSHVTGLVGALDLREGQNEEGREVIRLHSSGCAR